MNNKTISFAVMRNFLHKGHFNLVSEMLKNSDKVYVVLGSSQAKDDIRNPFSVKQRIDLIKLAFGQSSKIKIISIRDINAVSKVEWESFVLSEIKKAGLETPTDYWGGSADDVSWYGNVHTDNNEFLKINIVNRHESGIMSGTLVRQSIANDGTDWESHVPKCMISYIKEHFPKHLILSNILEERAKLIEILSDEYSFEELREKNLKELKQLIN